jgi:hypothetical protein
LSDFAETHLTQVDVQADGMTGQCVVTTLPYVNRIANGVSRQSQIPGVRKAIGKHCLEMCRPFPGGCTNLARHIKQQNPNKSVAVMIAGNSGRPGGGSGHTNTHKQAFVSSLHHHHTTQEEDVVANWLLTHQAKFGTDPNVLFNSTIGGDHRWGMTFPDWTTGLSQSGYTLKGASPSVKITDAFVIRQLHRLVAAESSIVKYNLNGNSYEAQLDRIEGQIVQTNSRTRKQRIIQYDIDCIYATLQGVDYRRASPLEYRDAWHVTNCALSNKGTSGFQTAEAEMRFSLVFVAGPLARPSHTLNLPRKIGDYTCTQARTYNPRTQEYETFRACVVETFIAAFSAMACAGDTIAIVCHVSGGIYAGPHSTAYGDKNDDGFHELQEVVKLALCHQLENGCTLGDYFDRVIFSPYRKP